MTHRRSIVLLVLIAVVLTGCGGSAGPAVDPTQDSERATPPAGGAVLEPLVTGRDALAPDGRYSFRVPADWISVEAPIAELSYRSTDPETPLTLNVAREELRQIRRPQAYAEAARKRVIEVYSNVLSLSLSPVRVRNHEAYRWIYTATVNGVEQYYYQLFVIDGGQGFVLTGIAPIQVDFASTQAMFDAIAGSLTFARG